MSDKQFPFRGRFAFRPTLGGRLRALWHGVAGRWVETFHVDTQNEINRRLYQQQLDLVDLVAAQDHETTQLKRMIADLAAELRLAHGRVEQLETTLAQKAEAEEEAHRVAEALAEEDARQAAEVLAEEDARQAAEALAEEEARKIAEALTKKEGRTLIEIVEEEEARKAAEVLAKAENRIINESQDEGSAEPLPADEPEEIRLIESLESDSDFAGEAQSALIATDETDNNEQEVTPADDAPVERAADLGELQEDEQPRDET